VSNKPLVAIVDDDEPMRLATSNLLESAGFATATFADAEAFLGSAHHRGVACLVTDMRMPGMTGIELRESLLASGQRHPHRPHHGLRRRGHGIASAQGRHRLLPSQAGSAR
jgi:FixJ family two-component response regulator